MSDTAQFKPAPAPVGTHGATQGPSAARVPTRAALTRFRLADVPAVPWKNGGGTTREIACWPPQSDMNTFDWRISVARIDRNGPFSSFEGIDRVITLIDGAGVRLHGVNHVLDRRLAPYAFDGGAAVEGELIDGACEDLNIMSRRAHIHAGVRVLHDAAELEGAGAGFLMAVRSTWRIVRADGAESFMLGAGDGIWWQGSLPGWTVTPQTQSADAGLIAVSLTDTRNPRTTGGAT